MRLVATSTIRHGDLYEAIYKKLGMSQSQFARECKISPTSVSRYILLKEKPSHKMKIRMQKVFNKHKVNANALNMWDDDFIPLSEKLVIDQYKDMTALQIEDLKRSDPILIEDISDDINVSCSENEEYCLDVLQRESLGEALEEVLHTLTDRESKILTYIFYEGCTLEETGKYFKVTRERIRQIMEKGLRKMRRPGRIRLLHQYINKHHKDEAKFDDEVEELKVKIIEHDERLAKLGG